VKCTWTIKERSEGEGVEAPGGGDQKLVEKRLGVADCWFLGGLDAGDSGG